jgi:protocatechuate 3,4-dioxygenase alpha subunit
MTGPTSGSQTVGPFFRIGLEHLCKTDGSAPLADADIVTVRGRVIDGGGNGVSDALLEIWHASPDGRYAADGPDERGRATSFTRAATGHKGEFEFSICRPGAIACNAGPAQAPHLAVLVFMRGLLRHLMTRMYFPDEPANESDPLLKLVPAERRATLIARAIAGEHGCVEWNVALQGDGETVFFAW